jgi:hypothetical protein
MKYHDNDRMISPLEQVSHNYMLNLHNLNYETAFQAALSAETNIENIKNILNETVYDISLIVFPALKRLIDLIPNDIDLYLIASAEAYLIGEDGLASEYLDKATDLNPSDIRVMHERLFQMFNAGLWQMRLLCQQILELDPNDKYARKCLDLIEEDAEFVGMTVGPMDANKWHIWLHDRDE